MPEVCMSKSPSACKSEKHTIINYYCSENTHIVTNTVLKKVKFLRHASLSLCNHFDTHKAQHHDTVFNHHIDTLPHQYVLQIPTLCLCCVCACTRACVYVRACV